jgi:crotonobetainyl-CoA:carnitine CoA-transferase CaiB-like acyl-CoA transferase
MEKLLETADVFIHNLAPGSVERLGWGYEEIKEQFPRLIWVGFSGYGPDGPYRDKKAYDLLIQAEAGVVSLTGTPETAAKVGISIADIAAGLYGYSSILIALLNREKTGCGDRIDISMFECLTEWMMPPLNVFMGTHKVPPRAGLRHNMIAPYGAYQCKDGKVLFSIQNEREWKQFCDVVLEQPDLTDNSRFKTNSLRLENLIELETVIEGKFRKFTTSAIIELLEKGNIANAIVNDVLPSDFRKEFIHKFEEAIENECARPYKVPIRKKAAEFYPIEKETQVIIDGLQQALEGAETESLIKQLTKLPRRGK